MDRLAAMAVFVAVADLRGFASAARRLDLSPSAVTRLVAALEERLGARLFQRTTRSVKLTDAGERFLGRARSILAAVAEAEEAAGADRTEPQGRFVVAAPNMFGRLQVAPLMSRYALRYPAVVCELTLADRLVHLVEEGVDAAVRIGELDDSTLVARRVGETRRVVVGTPKYLATRKKLRSPSDLASHDLVHFTALQPSPEWTFRDRRGGTGRGGERRVGFSPTFVTNSAEAAMDHAEHVGGLTMQLAYQVAAAVRTKRFRVILADFEPPPLPIHVVYPSTRLLSAKVRAFVDMVLDAPDRSSWRFTDL
ncbi:LysR family transcriptional regulator [soil metagenome]